MVKKIDRDVKRYIGLSLGGAKSDRTCLTVIDHYKKQDKAFIIDIFESIGSELVNLDEHHATFSSDEIILEIISEHNPGIEIIAVDAPLTLPPCLISCETNCAGYFHCKRPEIKWMNKQYKAAKQKNPKAKQFTPYTQRPIDLFFKYKYPELELQRDETLGANHAPQAARMQYLKRHLKGVNLIEVWPKLSLFGVHKSFQIKKNDLANVRNIEKGIGARTAVVEKISEHAKCFVYDRDFKKISSNISAFDSFICAWTALEYSRNRTLKPKSDFPLDTGWIAIPEI